MDKELNQFAEIVQCVETHNWKQAAKIVNEANFKAIDLIRINETARDGYLMYEDSPGHLDVVKPLESETFIAILIEEANQIKETK